jgi:hypothetical protein
MHCKKRLAVFPSPAEMSLTILSLAGNYSWPRESLVSDITAEDGKPITFFTVYVLIKCFLSFPLLLYAGECTHVYSHLIIYNLLALYR